MKKIINLFFFISTVLITAQNNTSYWQQHVNYKMDVDVDVENYTYSGTQKLVYTNIIDRFDTMIDSLIIENCREEGFIETSLANMSGTVTESDLVKILIHGENLQGALDLKLRNGLRNTILRERHSKKLSSVFKVFQPDINPVTDQRVNPPTGKISAKITPQKAIKIPYSISGYADWLYSRRNGVVHGAGSSFLKIDKARLKELYKYNCPSTFKMKIGATNNAVNFYLCIVEILRIEPE